MPPDGASPGFPQQGFPNRPAADGFFPELPVMTARSALHLRELPHLWRLKIGRCPYTLS
jgi:hypothetical protein